MKRSEFIERINLCSDWIKDRGFVCDAIGDSFNWELGPRHPIHDFQLLLSPDKAAHIWFGVRHNFKNQCDRFFALMLFKEIALTEKLYERY